MKYIVVLILISAAYVTGYLTPKENVSSSAAEALSVLGIEPEVKKDVLAEQIVIAAEATHSHIRNTDVNPEADSQGISPSSIESSTAKNTQPVSEPVVSNHSSGSAGQRPLTDEQIDKLVPAPFNQYLKGHDAALLEKYRKFSEQENPSSQDSDIFNKISDAIASNPYSKFLNIDSFQCKANFCELRLYESKSGVWSYIQAEMSLQDWWRFKSSSAHGFDTGKENISGWYVLLTKD